MLVTLLCVMATDAVLHGPPMAGCRSPVAWFLADSADMAASEGYDTWLAELLMLGADPNQAHRGKTLLTRASMYGRPPTVEVLLRQGADVNARDPDRYTALINAASWGYDGTVRTLLRHGADVNAKDPVGMTALQFAAASGRTATVRILLEARARTGKRGKSG